MELRRFGAVPSALLRSRLARLLPGCDGDGEVGDMPSPSPCTSSMPGRDAAEPYMPAEAETEARLLSMAP